MIGGLAIGVTALFLYAAVPTAVLASAPVALTLAVVFYFVGDFGAQTGRALYDQNQQNEEIQINRPTNCR